MENKDLLLILGGLAVVGLIAGASEPRKSGSKKQRKEILNKIYNTSCSGCGDWYFKNS